jgi:hypothetical protein
VRCGFRVLERFPRGLNLIAAVVKECACLQRAVVGQRRGFPDQTNKGFV